MQDDVLLRYSRQIMLPELDYSGQEKLTNSHALILGVGGLGSPASMYLAAAGVGTLTLVDDDTVELSNLQRQIAHRESSIGQNKAQSAKATLAQLNRHTHIQTITSRLDEAALRTQVEQADVVLDCTDNFASRLLTNQICVKQQTPLVSAAAIRWEGQLMVIDPNDPESACYECIYGHEQNQNLSCSETGVMSPVVGLLGVWQALEAIKVLSGVGKTLTNQLHIFDGFVGQWQKLNTKRNSQCGCCSHR